MLSEERIFEEVQSIFVSCYLNRTDKERDSTGSSSNQYYGMQSRIIGFLTCVYGDDEEAYSLKYTELKQKAYDSLPEHIKENVKKEAEEWGRDNPVNLI